MASNLKIEQDLSATSQAVKDQSGNPSPLALSTGNVGIGTTNPQGKLDVSDNIVLNGNVKTQLSAAGDTTVIKGGTIVLDLSPSGGGQLHVACNPNDNRVVLEGFSSDGKTPAPEMRITGRGAVSLPVFTVAADITRFLGPVRITSNLTVDETARFKKNVNVDGNVVTAGDIQLTNAADCAEDFDVCDIEQAQPGTVMVLAEDGKLRQSETAYDKRVAGVISGAGDYKPGIVLDKQHSQIGRKPIALIGKVFCKVDAQFGAIEVGDLLTTAPTPGHAMRATDPFKSFGTVLGKALRPLAQGQGLIPMLIALQ
jgi:hypothetical protein